MEIDGLPTALAQHAHSHCTAATPTANYRALRLPRSQAAVVRPSMTINTHKHSLYSVYMHTHVAHTLTLTRDLELQSHAHYQYTYKKGQRSVGWKREWKQTDKRTDRQTTSIAVRDHLTRTVKIVLDVLTGARPGFYSGSYGVRSCERRLSPSSIWESRRFALRIFLKYDVQICIFLCILTANKTRELSTSWWQCIWGWGYPIISHG